MKLVHHTLDAQHTLTGHGPGYVILDGERVTTSIVVSARRLLRSWAEDFDSLTPDHFAVLLSFQPEVVLLGTGSRFRFPDPALGVALAEAQIGLEAMDTAAAVRTYNVLASEDRRVVVALLLG